MKKRYAVIMAAAMMTGVMAATALAEGPGMDGGQQMSGPQIPGDNEMGQPPQMNGKGPEDGFGFIEFKDYVEDGTISQETYDAITKFMEENKPDLPEGMEEGERPELPEGVKNGEKPELPEGAKEDERPEMKEGEGPDLLKDLLEAGVITQEEYDTLAAAREANKPAAPAANQNNDSTQTTNESAGA